MLDLNDVATTRLKSHTLYRDILIAKVGCSMERKLSRVTPDLEKVTAASKELKQHTVETDVLKSVQYGSIVVIEILGENPQTKRVQLVDDLEESQGGVKRSQTVDMFITSKSPIGIGTKILGQTKDDKEIIINPKTRVKILEIIDPEPTGSPELQ